jgi:hypothetical protein
MAGHGERAAPSRGGLREVARPAACSCPPRPGGARGARARRPRRPWFGVAPVPCARGRHPPPRRADGGSARRLRDGGHAVAAGRRPDRHAGHEPDPPDGGLRHERGDRRRRGPGRGRAARPARDGTARCGRRRGALVRVPHALRTERAASGVDGARAPPGGDPGPCPRCPARAGGGRAVAGPARSPPGRFPRPRALGDRDRRRAAARTGGPGPSARPRATAGGDVDGRHDRCAARRPPGAPRDLR